MFFIIENDGCRELAFCCVAGWLVGLLACWLAGWLAPRASENQNHSPIVWLILIIICEGHQVSVLCLRRAGSPWPVSQPASQPASPSASQPVSQPANLSASHPASKPASQSTSQTSQPVSRQQVSQQAVIQAPEIIEVLEVPVVVEGAL